MPIIAQRRGIVTRNPIYWAVFGIQTCRIFHKFWWVSYAKCAILNTGYERKVFFMGFLVAIIAIAILAAVIVAAITASAAGVIGGEIEEEDND